MAEKPPICCGKRRLGNFCEECGKSLPKPTAILRLLGHLRAVQNGYAKKADDLRTEIADQKASTSTVTYKTKGIERAAKHSNRWKEWADALEELLAKDGGKL